MPISDLLSEDLVISDLQASDQGGVLRELVDRIVASRRDVDREVAVAALAARESEGSTAAGRGVAIPSARLPTIERTAACFGRSTGGVEFGAVDGRPVQLFLVLLTPDNSTHLLALAGAARIFRDAELRRRLIDAPDVWAVLRSQTRHLRVRT